MRSTYPIFVLLVVPLAVYGLEVGDLFPQDMIAQVQLRKAHPDFGLDIYHFLAKYGYPVEDHEVTTEDGYILNMHRIPHGRNQAGVTITDKPAVLLMHGLLCSSMDWVNTGPQMSLALNLADAGYDVWLGNNRGNTWSRRHLSLDPDNDEEFWDYSFDNCGNYDLPAKIDHILELTGQEKVNYVGHSQGTTQFFAMAALRPEYNDKIRLMTALAPVAYMKDLTQPLAVYLANYTSLLENVFDQLKIHEFLPYTQFLMEVIQILCHNDSPYQQVCIDVLFFLGGSDPAQFDGSLLEIIGSNTPAGISTKMLIHYLQEIYSGYFRRYDYGNKNIEIYQRNTPPLYDVALITAPVALYYGRNDPFAAVSDVEQLANELPNLVKQNLVEYELFTHLDFIWANDVKTMINDDVIALLNTFNFAT